MVIFSNELAISRLGVSRGVSALLELDDFGLDDLDLCCVERHYRLGKSADHGIVMRFVNKLLAFSVLM